MFVDTPASIAILGAGPIGLEAALYARYLGYKVELLERGRVCDSVLRWGHVRLFSPFGMNASPLGLAALAAQDESFAPPGEDELLTGRQWAERYLLPLARSDLLADCVQENTRVLAVSRSDCLKGEFVGEPERAASKFRLLLEDASGERFAEADVVIDTTGTYGQHNWLGRGGIPAAGECDAEAVVEYGLPDVLDSHKETYAGRHTLVVGGGYSAATSVVDLAELASQSPGTRVTWVTLHKENSSASVHYPRIENDRLPARDELARRANELAAAGSTVTHLAGTTVESVRAETNPQRFTVRLTGEHAGEQAFDRVIANVGYRPDTSLYEELQVHTCYASGGPMKLAAALLGETSADCLDQSAHGPQTLVTTEPNFYILGSKSYGRGSNFLVSIGLAQVRELFSLIAGREDLDLYATAKATFI